MIIYIDENDENKRLDSFLSEITPDISRSKIQNFIKAGCIKINDTLKKPSYILKENDKVDFEIPDDQKELEIKPQNIPIEIVYEDENMLVVSKPSGMLTHTLYDCSVFFCNSMIFYLFGKKFMCFVVFCNH